jgi:uncharacterized protein (TIGR03382 family)
MRPTACLLALAATVAAPRAAHAFCGFYVAGSGDQLVNDATQVVLMRDGTRTVLAMQNDYKGPPTEFAMIIPVPTVLHEEDVKTLTKEVFQHVEQMGAPRLVEYWEQDPCFKPRKYELDMAIAQAPMEGAMAGSGTNGDHGVKIEAKFTVGEYQILILSAKDSTGLDSWLRDNKYQVPKGAEPLLRPYVESGMKFFVAKVDPKKVHFENGHAALSPLRFHYDSDDFSLPIRLGMANSSGTQDLIVNIFAPHQRYRVANYQNVTIPTNLDVKDDVKKHFGAFYAALFDATIAKNPGAVVTEYAWQATTCDPCPGPTLQPTELMTLGADVLSDKQQDQQQPGSYGGYGYDFVLTRLHARYGTDLKDDLRFEKAEPIVGGREFVMNNDRLEVGSRADTTNNFQARYAIRHPWEGPIACLNPKRGVWGGPPNGYSADNGGTKPALDLAFVKRDEVKLAAAVPAGIPELGIKSTSGCGCNSSGTAPTGAAIALGTLLAMLRGRRRPKHRI